jgi:glycosyltransferase involved in cell wall biosynthesis
LNFTSSAATGTHWYRQKWPASSDNIIEPIAVLLISVVRPSEVREIEDQLDNKMDCQAGCEVTTAVAKNSQFAPTMLQLSVVMPCLNESLTIGSCVKKALDAIDRLGVRGEVIVADNGSTDGSQAIATELGARVVPISARGYGSALRGGIAAARGRYIIMGDSDASYDFNQLGDFFKKLDEGYELVMGNRFQGGIRPGAMPFLHRFLGNPFLSWLGRVFFGCPVGDFQCGLRGFQKEAVDKLNLRTEGMEFSTEMVVKATLFNLRIAEIPTVLFPDGRDRPPHLRTWRDGWRYLRFLLLYSPRWLFLYPGVALFLLGIGITAWLLPGPQAIGKLTFDYDTLLFGAMTILVGFQSINFAAFSKLFATSEGLLPEDPFMNRLYRYITLEVGLIIGALLVLAGASMWVLGLGYWHSHNFGPLDPEKTLRIVIPGFVSLTLGIQIILSSFFLSVLGIGRK